MTNYPPGLPQDPQDPQDPQNPQNPQNPQGQPGQPGQYPQYPQQGQYPQYPQGGYPPQYGSGPGFGQPATPPPSIINAVRLMYAGAGLSLVSLILTFATLSSIRTAIRNAANTAGTSISSAQVDTLVNVAIASAVVFGLVGAGLWVWMAQMNKGGKSWARITATVFFGIDTLGLLASFSRPSGGVTLIFSILIWLVGLGAVIFMWQKPSTAYYNATR